MKPINPRIQELVVLAALLLTLFVSGCASGSGASGSPGGSDRSRTLKQTDMDVSWPMTRFRNTVAAGGITTGEKEQVNRAYAEYQAAYREALQAANNNPDAPAPDNVKALATKVISAVDAAH